MARSVRWLVMSVAVTVLTLAGVMSGLAARVWVGGSEPTRPGATPIPQTAESAADGLTIRALSATFSGTETVLNFSVVASDGSHRAVTVPDGAWSGQGLAGGTARGFQRLDDGSYLIELPAVWRPGEIPLTVSELRDDSGARRSGPWQLALAGPAERDFEGMMRVESFVAGRLDLDGVATLVTGRRSTSRTIVEYSIPSAWRELTPPTITTSGETFLSLGTRPTSTGVQASFPATRFGETVVATFGPFGVAGTEADAIVLQLGAVLERSDGGTPAAVVPEDIVAGRSDLLLSARDYRHDVGSPGRATAENPRPAGTVDVVEITVRGNWHPTDPVNGDDPSETTPSLVDSAGRHLFRIISSINYSKDANGTIGEGQTTIVFWKEPGANLSQATLILGSPSRVIAGTWSVELTPS